MTCETDFRDQFCIPSWLRNCVITVDAKGGCVIHISEPIVFSAAAKAA
jgi:hypothetical protein